MDDPLDDALVRAYLARLGLPRPPPDATALADLVERHLYTVPFENLDVVEGRPIALGTTRAAEKIVERRRGGFCFELNEAFRGLLVALGYSVRRIEARVWVEATASFGAPFDHLALVVSLDGTEILVDVGFGDNNRRPLRLPQDEVTDVSGRYRLGVHRVDADRAADFDGHAADRKVANDDAGVDRPGPGRDGDLILERLEPAQAARPLYEVTLAPRALADFSAMCAFHQSAATSIFTKGPICSLPLPDGRVTLTSTRLIEVRNGQRRDHPVADLADRNRLLRKHFGVAV